MIAKNPNKVIEILFTMLYPNKIVYIIVKDNNGQSDEEFMNDFKDNLIDEEGNPIESEKEEKPILQ